MSKNHYRLLLAGIVICITAFCLFWAIERRKASTATAPARDYQIQVIFKAYKNPPAFWREVGKGITAAQEEFGVHCEITAPDVESDIDQQIALVREAIAKKPDALILAATDYEKLVPVCKEATDAGILLVTVDSDVNLPQRAAFVSTDNYEMGRKLAGLLEEQCGTEASFGVIGHVESASTAVDRLAGLLDNTPSADTRMAGLAWCDGYVEYAKQLSLRMLDAHPEITCMVGLNESSALGIVAALQERELVGKVSLVVCDSSEEQIRSLENGTIQACVVQNPFSMGYFSVSNAIQLLNRQSVPPITYTDSVVVHKGNLRNPNVQQLIIPFNS